MWLAEGAPKGFNLFIPPWSEVIIALVAVGLIAIVVVKYAVPRYFQVLDERAEVIEGGIARARDAESEIARVRQGLDAEKEAARIEAARLREEAKTEAQAIVAAAKAKAADDARRTAEAAQRQIESERKAAEVSLRADVGSLATELAERIVGEALKDTALAGRVVDRFLAELDERAPSGKSA
ncbi:MAG: F0F1 ATP synthase subunit B [Bifidobacteriaceae bacterium]|jgi:F-type H+-transporting ATPase subunit b|nr:F0F1 ATP synthase subunit B [Bifidobacteriaceae bacterium]